MKKFGLIAVTVFMCIAVFGQKTEYNVVFNSGLFRFGGKQANFVNTYGYRSGWEWPFLTNAFGSFSEPGYGLSANIKIVTKTDFLFGADVGYERFTSKTTGYVYQTPLDSGGVSLSFSFLTLQPYTGFRIALKQLNLDMTAGMDIGYCLQAKRGGGVTARGNLLPDYSSSLVKTKSIDVRPRLQLTASIKAVGLYVGYSHGLINYYPSMAGRQVSDHSGRAYTRILRFGIAYRVK